MPDANSLEETNPPPRLIEALLEWSEDSTPPEKDILALAEAMKKDDSLAAQTIRAFNGEIARVDNQSKTFFVWLSFALGLSGRDDAAEALYDFLLRASKEDLDVPTGMVDACRDALLLLPGWTLPRIVSMFPLEPEDEQAGELAFTMLHLCRAADDRVDETLRRLIAEEAVRLLSLKGLPNHLVIQAGAALAASDPQSALKAVPRRLCGGLRSDWMKNVLRKIRKKGRADGLLSIEWQPNAEEAARDLLDELYCDLEDDEYSAEKSLENAMALVGEFIESRQRKDLPECDGQQIAADLRMSLRYLFDYHAKNLEETDAADIASMMADTLPRKFTADSEDFRSVARALHSFFTFLDDRGGFPNAAACAVAVDKNTERMVKNAGDPSYWGMAKGHCMSMMQSGVDPRDQDAVTRMHEYNRKMDIWPEEDGPLRWPDSPVSIREERIIEIGPYDPCPCGSGTKYKFCCKKKNKN